MQVSNRRQIAEAVVHMIEKGFSREVIVQSLAAYLIDERRVQELDSLLRDIEKLRSEKGAVEITVSGARTMSPALRSNIEDFVIKNMKLQGQIIINEITDAELIGGVKIETVDRQLDLTIRSRLNRFKQLAAK